MSERERILQDLLEIASEAADIVRAVYETDFAIHYKGPSDPVTTADQGANALIVRRLSALHPGVPVVAEESDPASFSSFRDAPRVFFVDPLDGTREFIEHNDEFAVMIGLLEDERPSLGVINAPALGVAWGGIVGSGAWRFSNGSREPIHVSSTAALASARIVASRSHRTAILEEALNLLGAARLDPLGSAGLKCHEVAVGRAEAYVAPGPAGCRWDVCAGEALVTAAGGRVSDVHGDPIDYRGEKLANDTGVLASNGWIHEAILARIRAIRANH